MFSVHLFVAPLLGWFHGEHNVVKYLRGENRVLKAQLRQAYNGY